MSLVKSYLPIFLIILALAFCIPLDSFASSHSGINTAGTKTFFSSYASYGKMILSGVVGVVLLIWFIRGALSLLKGIVFMAFGVFMVILWYMY